jgi:hypothetical protein
MPRAIVGILSRSSTARRLVGVNRRDAGATQAATICLDRMESRNNIIADPAVQSAQCFSGLAQSL